MAKRLSKKQLAAIHAKNSNPPITFKDTKETKSKIIATNHTMNVSSSRFYSDTEILRQQKIKAIEQQREDLRKQSFVSKLIPDSVEASASFGGLGLKATWHPKV